jgi:glutamate 5-kinase
MQHTIIIKIGSSSLTSGEGGLNREKINFFARELAALQKAGNRVLLVTSGAVAAGFSTIGYLNKPKALHEKQAAAAVGQALLMQAYNEAFHKDGVAIAQILLTRADFSNRQRIQNALKTLEELLVHQIIPIINENDTVAVEELKFGENDKLSALVANVLKANQLIIITDMDGMYTEDPRINPAAKRIDRVEQFRDELYQMAGGSGSSVGTGGMRSKLEAARIATRGGVSVFIGSVMEQGDLAAAVADCGKGTYFSPESHSLSMKKQWVGYHSLSQGTIYVDQGAEVALITGGKSLLPAGVTEIIGEFIPGDVIEVRNREKRVIGRGIVNYAAWQLQAVSGLSSEEVQKRVEVQRIEVIHRDEWLTI